MASERVPQSSARPRPMVAIAYGKDAWLAGWRQPWWKPAIGIPLYCLSIALIAGGLLGGLTIAAVQGIELLLVAGIAADAWGLRGRLPLLGSGRKSRAFVGWLLLLAAALSLALALPAV